MLTRHRIELTKNYIVLMPWGLTRFHQSGIRHILLLPSPSVVYRGCKPTNLRVSLGGCASPFQASGLRVRTHAGACSPPAQRTTTGNIPLKPKPGLTCRALLGWADEGVRPHVGSAGYNSLLDLISTWKLMVVIGLGDLPMRLSEAILLGSTVLTPRAGSIFRSRSRVALWAWRPSRRAAPFTR